MAKVLVDESCFSGIADAIREKTSSTATYKPREMADAISKIQGGAKTKFGLSIDNVIGDVSADGTLSASKPADVVLEGVTGVNSGAIAYMRTARSFTVPDVTRIETTGAFSSAHRTSPALTAVSFPKLEAISASNAFFYAFANCVRLVSVGFPKLASVSGGYVFQYAFSSDTKLAGVSFPALEAISGERVFTYCFSKDTSLASVSFPELVSISGQYIFDDCFLDCTNLASVSFPKLETISGGFVFYYAFSGCTSLVQIEFPALTVIDTNPGDAGSGGQFNNSLYRGGLVTAKFPKLKAIYANGSAVRYGPFYYCNKLARIDLPALTTIGTHYTGKGTVSDTAIKNMFSSCSALKEIHFGAANQAAVEAMPGYGTLWGLGAGKATVYFDL